jgi:hypothetical protein
MYSITDPWARLQHVMVGTCHTHLNLPWIQDSFTRSTLEKILRETQEDLDSLASWLTTSGCKVSRPKADSTNLTKRPTISPRDDILVVDDRLFVDVPNINGSNIHYFGDRLCVSRDVDPAVTARLFPNYNIIRYYLTGHVDGWFSIPTPGLIVSGIDHQRPDLMKMFYKTYFADHEVVYVSETLAKADWGLNRTHQTWTSHGDLALSNFLDQYLSSWTGTPEETIFEINMLILDRHNVVTNCVDDIVLTALQRYGVTSHIVPFRHAAFWDCGIHCATADLQRKCESPTTLASTHCN